MEDQREPGEVLVEVKVVTDAATWKAMQVVPRDQLAHAGISSTEQIAEVIRLMAMSFAMRKEK